MSVAEWMENHILESDLDMANADDRDRFLLSKKPSQRALRYTRMMAFGNHFRVEDETSAQHVSYNSGVASVFEENFDTEAASSVPYVGVLKDILLLHYGVLQSKIILLRCEWVKPYDNRGNPTYTRDDSGFLVVNFRHKLPRLAEPFIFPSQATQVFFSDVVERPDWKVVLCKDARSKREVLETSDAFISTTVETVGLLAPGTLPRPPEAVNLVGAIELSVEDNLLVLEQF